MAHVAFAASGWTPGTAALAPAGRYGCCRSAVGRSAAAAAAIVPAPARLTMMAKPSSSPYANKGRARKGKPTAKGTPGAGAAGTGKLLEPEEVFYEGKPSWVEVVIPTFAILTVVGVIPWAGAVARQLWVKYKFTSRRIAVDSGFRGNDHTEVVYRDIEEVRFVRRFGGAAADMVLLLKDGARLELRSLDRFDELYDYVMGKVDVHNRVVVLRHWRDGRRGRANASGWGAPNTESPPYPPGRPTVGGGGETPAPPAQRARATRGRAGDGAWGLPLAASEQVATKG